MTVRRKMTQEMRLVQGRVNKRRSHRSSTIKLSPFLTILAVKLWRGAKGGCYVFVVKQHTKLSCVAPFFLKEYW
jgi:hypothetical protein